MAIDKIVHHEDWQPGVQIEEGGRVLSTYSTMHEFLSMERLGHGPPGSVQGELRAYINHGRWMVECPLQGCEHAVIASMEEPVFFCSACGNVGNDGHSFGVVFPRWWRALERELIKRPIPMGKTRMSASTRNWRPGESLNDIKRENIAHKVA